LLPLLIAQLDVIALRHDLISTLCLVMKLVYYGVL